MTFALDRGGLVGADGPTHHGVFDLAYLRCVPNLLVMTPSDAEECEKMLTLAYNHAGPAAVRYPRGSAISSVATSRWGDEIELGKSRIVREGIEPIVILVFGTLLSDCLKAGARLDATVVDMRFVKPIDEQRINELLQKNKYFITVEDGVIMGGGGSAVAEVLGGSGHLLRLGVPDRFIQHGDTETLMAECGLDEEALYSQIMSFTGG